MSDILETAQDWFNQNIGAGLGDVTNKAADSIESLTDKKISATTVKELAPIVAAAAVGGTGIMMSGSMDKIGKSVSKVVRNLVTGFGYFEKIPLVGGVFSGAGWVVDKIGDYSGYLLTGGSSLLAYHLFKSKPTAPSANPENTPNSGTGARPQEPLTKRITITKPGSKEVVAQENAPDMPRPVADSPSTTELAKTNPDLKKVNYEILAQERSKAIRAKRGEYSEQLRALMQEENQRYENRRLFLKRVEEFTKTGGGRDHLVNALFINGMTEAEAKQLVPAAPNLRYTVTSGATPATNSKEEDKTTDFGGDFSQLQGLGKRLQGFYGKGYFPVSQINSKNEREEVRIDFDAMSVTQKHEFIEKALEHARTKYRELSSKVRTRTYVTSANYAGATTSSEVVYDFDSIPAATYHHENGSSGKVTTPRQEYDFLSGLNGDTVRSVNYGNGVSGYNARGSELVKGDGLNGSSGAFNNWAVLLSEHKAELKRAEESYSGGIRTYTRNLAFLNNSMQQNHLHAVALLSRTENSLNIRDLRKFTGTASNDDVVRLSGDWNADETVFTLRALPNKKGELVALPTAVAINIVTGEGMAEALQKMDNIRTAPAQDQAKAASPVVVSNLDRAGKIPSATLSRKRRDGSEIINQFAGRYEGNKFIATGLVQRGSLTFPKIPADKLLPYRKRDDYALEGKNALSGTYLMRGRIFRDVKLKGPDGSVKIYVVETGSGWEKRPLIGIGLKEEGYDRANLAWYQEDSDAHLLSHTVVKLSYNEIGNYDSHYIAAAQDAAARMDNAVIQRENENRRKTFESNLTDIERKAITPLAQGELVVSDVNKAEDWEVLTNNLRYHAGNVTDKATAHKDDPFKASKHMVEISDRDLNLSSRVILHGTYNKETKQFVMEGYELRHDGIPGDKPGQYVTKAATIDMHKRNFAETFAHVNKELNTGLRAEFKKDNDYFLVRDNRKPGLPQNLMMKFTPAQGGNYELEYCVNYCDDDMITVDAFCVGVTPKSEGIIISGADYEALKEGRKSMDTLLDKMDTLAKGKIAVKLKETDYREKMTLTITDNRSDIPKTYDITMKYDDAKKAIVTESISTGGKTVMKQVVMGDLNKPKTWTDLIDGAQELRTANLGAMPGIKSMRDQLAGLSAQQGVEVKTMPTAASYMPAIANLNALSQPIILAA